MFWPRPEKSCSNKKVAFSQIDISLLKNFGGLVGWLVVVACGLYLPRHLFTLSIVSQIWSFSVLQIVVVGQSWLVSACRWPALDQDMIAEWTGLGSWASLRRKYVSNNAIRPCSSWWYQLKRPCPQCPALLWGDKVSKVRLKLKISTTQVQMSRLARANVAWVEFEELRLHHIERNFTAVMQISDFPEAQIWIVPF